MAPLSIDGKVVLVTGANRGIGKAIVEGFRAAGAQKIYAGVRQIETAPIGTVPLYMDLMEEDSIVQASKDAPDVHIVVNSAGILDFAHPLAESAVSTTKRQMETNLYGLMHVARYFVPLIDRNQGGAFIQINSTSSLRCPRNTFGGYAASKAAAYMFVQSLRSSLNEKSSPTRVLSVHPGPIATDMVAQFGATGEPASQVSDAILEALATENQFLVYTDSLSRNIGQEYQHFADTVIESVTRPTTADTNPSGAGTAAK